MSPRFWPEKLSIYRGEVGGGLGVQFPKTCNNLRHRICLLEVLKLALSARLFIFFQPETLTNDSLDPHLHTLLSLNKKKTKYLDQEKMEVGSWAKWEEHFHLPEAVEARRNTGLLCS